MSDTFEAFLKRPVYVTQCKTFAVAKRISKTQGNVLMSTDILCTSRKPPFCLRIVKPYRDEMIQRFRDAVAAEVRHLRNGDQAIM